MHKIHEHIIEVTNPADELAKELTPETIWRHLEYFAKAPAQFIEALEICEIHEETQGGDVVLNRRLDFGNFLVLDRVLCKVGQALITDIPKTEHYPASRFSILLETPAQGVQILRFIYEEDVEQMPEEDIFLKLRRQAYEQKDRHMVDVLRDRVKEIAKLN